MMSPHRQLVEAFVAQAIGSRPTCWWPAATTHLCQRWLDLGGARRGRRRADGQDADVRLDVVGDANVLGDAQRLPFHDGAFALVTAVEMLYLVPDLERALSEVHRVLAPGGRLVATCPFSRQENEPGDWRRPTAHAWRWMLERAMFHVERVEALGGPYSLMWQAAYIASRGEGTHAEITAHNMARSVYAVRGASVAGRPGGPDTLRVCAVPLQEPHEGGEPPSDGSPGRPQPQKAATGLRRLGGACVTRSAGLARWLDARSGVSWPLGHGIVATR